MSAEALLSKLAKVKRRGVDQWNACCPAHDDKSPSLSIRELQDGRVLVHCWVGCSVDEILGAVGLEFGDLFPEKLTDYAPRERIPFSHREVLANLVPELMLIAIASNQLTRGEPLTTADHERLVLASERVSSAYNYAEGL